MSQSDHRTIRTVPRDSDPAADRPRALAVRIGDRDLWLANSGGARPENLDAMELSPAHVVSVNRQATAATTDHHPLRDAYVNDQQEFAGAVEAVRQRHQESGDLMVNCAAGISRSTTVLATALAVDEDRSFADTVDEVATYRERARPHPKLQVNALSYLVAEHGRHDARSALAEVLSRVRLTSSDQENAVDQLDELDEDVTAQ